MNILQNLYNGQPEDHKKIFRFTNIFRFMDFCYLNKLTERNSVTEQYIENGRITVYITRKSDYNVFRYEASKKQKETFNQQ